MPRSVIAKASWLLFPALVGGAAESRTQCNFPEVHVGPDGLEFTTFAQQYRGQRPILLKNATPEWSAHRVWPSGGFLRLHGNLSVMPKNPAADVAFEEFEDSISVQRYLEDDAFKKKILFDFSDFTVYRQIVKEIVPVPLPLLRIRGEPSFSLGRKGTGSGSHRHEENWMTQVVGRKAWFVAHPDASDSLMSSDGNDHRPCRLLKRDRRPKGVSVCVVGEGETVYVPAHWHHATCNMDDLTIGVGGRNGGNNADASGWPPHIFHIVDGNVAALKQATATRTDVLKGDVAGSALHYAARAGDLHVLAYLLDLRANPLSAANVESDFEGLSPMGIAARHGHREVLEALFKISGLGEKQMQFRSHKGLQPVHQAARRGHAACVEFFLDHGAPAYDDVVKAPLAGFACVAGSTKILESLASRRVDLSMRGGDGVGPVHMAAWAGHLSVATKLLALGVSPEDEDLNGEKPADVAAREGHHDVAALLISQQRQKQEEL